MVYGVGETLQARERATWLDGRRPTSDHFEFPREFLGEH